MRFFLKILLISALCLAFGKSDAQQLTASCKYSKIALDKSFQVTYTLTGGNASQFTRPAFTDFTLGGTSQGTVITNGNYKNTWTYTLKPTAVGTYTINAAKANVNGTWITSNTLSIEVTQGTTSNNSNNNNSNNSSNSSNSTNSNSTSSNTSGNDVFLKAYVDNASPYEGEQVILTYKIYMRIPVTQINFEKLPSFTGFWSEELSNDNDKLVESTETVNGVQYTVADVRKVVLFPEKSGTLTIDPLNVKCDVQVVKQQQYVDPFANFFNDPFFNNMTKQFFNTYSQEEKTVASNSLTLNVKPLPTSGQPSEFKGSVGTFTFDASIDKTKLKTNEAANLKFTLTGSGNLSMAELPEMDFPADLETYDPDIKENITTTAAGVSGSKTFSYLIIPRSAGEFTIKPVKFCYYDLTKKSYITLESPEFTLNVEKGSGDDASVSSLNKEDIKYLNSDIYYLKSSPVFLTTIGSFFYGSPFFFGLIGGPLLLFFLFVIIYRRRLKENSNIALMKNKKATAVANKRLNAANVFLKENKKDAFLDEIFRALWGYVSDKLNIPISELSKDTVSDKFTRKNVNEEISKQFIATLNNCEFARFAPDDGSVTMNSIYDEAAGIITKMERELR